MGVTRSETDEVLGNRWTWIDQSMAKFGNKTGEYFVLARQKERVSKAIGLIYLAMGY